MKKIYKLLALVISLAMLFTALPVGALDEEALEPSIVEDVIEEAIEEVTEEIIEDETPEEISGGVEEDTEDVELFEDDADVELMADPPAEAEEGKVAWMGGTWYEDFDTAAEAGSGKTIYLYDDVTSEGRIHASQYWQNATVIGVAKAGGGFPVITIENDTEEIGMRAGTTGFENIILDLKGHYFNLYTGGSTLNLTNTTIRNGKNTSGAGGAIRGTGAANHIVMNDTVFENCVAGSSGGAIFLTGTAGGMSSITMNGGEIKGCTSSDSAVYLNGYVTINVSGTATIAANTLTDSEALQNLEFNSANGKLSVTDDFTGSIGFTKSSDSREFSDHATKASTEVTVSKTGFFDDSDKENSVVEENGTTLSILVIKGVARVGDTWYDSYEAAASALGGSAGDTSEIHVYADSDTQGTVYATNTYWNKGKIIGHKKANGEYPVIRIVNKAKTEIPLRTGITAFENITIDLNGHYFKLFSYGCTVHLYGGATIQNGYHAGHGGAFYAINLDNPTIIMEEGSKIENCISDGGHGGAIFLGGNNGKKGSFVMNGGEITGCGTDSTHSGAVYLYNYVDMTIKGNATIAENYKVTKSGDTWISDTTKPSNLAVDKTTPSTEITVTDNFTGEIGYTKLEKDLSVYAKKANEAVTIPEKGFFDDADKSHSVVEILSDGLTITIGKTAAPGDVARVDDTWYDDFDTAAAAAADKTIYVYANDTSTGTPYNGSHWQKGKTVGVAKADGTYPVITIVNDSKTEIPMRLGTTEFENITIDLGGHYFKLWSGCPLTLTNTTIRNGKNTSGAGGAFYSNGTNTVTMTNSIIENCHAKDGGGAIFLTGVQDTPATFTMEGGEIRGCTSSGGAVYLNGYVTMNVSGDAKIATNTLADGETLQNLAFNSVNGKLIVTDDFTGSIGFTQNSDARDFSTHATRANTDVTISETAFFDDADKAHSVVVVEGLVVSIGKVRLPEEIIYNETKGIYYTDFNTAMNEVSSGNIIYVYDNCDFTLDIDLKGVNIIGVTKANNKAPVIDFNRAGAGAIITEDAATTLSLENITVDLSNKHFFRIGNGATVHLKKGATIKNGSNSATGMGGALSGPANNHHVIMESGSKIENCSAANGGAIFLTATAESSKSTLTMYGGTIKNCVGNGAIALNNYSEFKVGGDATVSSNTMSDGTMRNVIGSHAVSKIILMEGNFTGSIGITNLQGGIEITAFATAEAGAKGAENFFSDNDKFGYEGIMLSDGTLKLQSNLVTASVDTEAGKVTINEEEVISKNANKGAEIVLASENDVKMWIDTSIGKILSEEAGVNFNIGTNRNIKPVFEENEKANVFFISRSGQVIRHSVVANGSTIATVPTDAEMAAEGYTLAGWTKIDADGETYLNKDQIIGTTINKDTKFVAQYSDNAITKNITVVKGTIGGEAATDKPVVYNTSVTVEANTPAEGEEFAGWLMNGEIISYNPTFSFYMGRFDVTLEATYAAMGTVTKTPLITMTERAYNNGEYNIAQFLTTRYLPEGFTLLETGVIFADDVRMAADSLLTNQVGKKVSGVEIKAGRALRLTDTQYALSANFFDDGIKARGYMVYREEATGLVKTIYTDAAALTEANIQ